MKPHAFFRLAVGVAVVLTVIGGPAQAQRSAPSPVAAAASTPERNYAPALPALIRGSQQVTLYAPTLNRADVAEAIRLSLIERGTRALLLTNYPTLMTPNSLAFRLQLMGNDTYAVNVNATPFIIIDGLVYAGAGVTGAGRVRLLPTAQARSVIQWAQSTIDRLTPLILTTTMKAWTLKNVGIKLVD